MSRTRLLAVVALWMVAAVACLPRIESPALEPTIESRSPEGLTPAPAEPVSPDSSLPAKASPGSATETGKARVESVEIMILESFPVQVRVRAAGHLPDGCTQIEQVTQERIGDTFQVTISTVRPAGMECTEALVGFEQSIPLDVVGLPAGTYVVDVNGVCGSFELSVDNVLPQEAGPRKTVKGEAPVESVDAGLPAPGAAHANVLVEGYLPDGCTTLGKVIQERDGRTFRITLTTERPADMQCITVIVRFEQVIQLDVTDLEPGTYSVVVNGVKGSFELPPAG